MRKLWPRKLLVKGILRSDDAERCIEASGYRRVTDNVKALALGANAVLLGRATLYGLAAAGGAGGDHVLGLLKDEVDRTLAQIGCPSIRQLSPDYVVAGGSMPTTAPRLREEIDMTIP